jgi:hypothetical protein
MDIELGFLDGLRELSEPDTVSPYPVLTVRYRNSILLIDGIKRISNTSITPIISDSCRLITKEDQVCEWFKINSSHRKITETEKAYIICNLLKHNPDYNFDNLSCYLDISPKLLPYYSKLAALPIVIKRYILRHNTAQNITRIIVSAPESIIKEICGIISDHEINPANLKNLIEYSSDIWFNKGLNPLQEKEFRELLKLSGLKNAICHIKTQRYPELTRKQKAIKSAVASLNLSKIRIESDDNFEQDFLSIRLPFNKKESIEDIKNDFKKLQSSKVLDIIFDEYSNHKKEN